MPWSFTTGICIGCSYNKHHHQTTEKAVAEKKTSTCLAWNLGVKKKNAPSLDLF